MRVGHFSGHAVARVQERLRIDLTQEEADRVWADVQVGSAEYLRAGPRSLGSRSGHLYRVSIGGQPCVIVVGGECVVTVLPPEHLAAWLLGRRGQARQRQEAERRAKRRAAQRARKAK